MLAPPWIFLSYRNEHSGYMGAARIAAELEAIFGKGTVFYAPATLAPGVTWEQVIERALLECKVLIALIEKTWSLQRLHDPNDWVRRELQVALAASKDVVPFLVDGATMPEAIDLPVELRALPDKQGVPIHTGWEPGFKATMRAVADRVMEGVSSELVIERDTESWWERLTRNDWSVLCDGTEILKLEGTAARGSATVLSGRHRLMIHWSEAERDYHYGGPNFAPGRFSSGETASLEVTLRPGKTAFRLVYGKDERAWWSRFFSGLSRQDVRPRSIVQTAFEPPSWQHT